MNHTIIIPVRGRDDELMRCLRSLQAADRVPDDALVTVYVVVAGSAVPPRLMDWTGRPRVRIVLDHDHPRGFNKARLLNRGLAEDGFVLPADIITFLDADMLVGPRFLAAAPTLLADAAAERPTRVCYRVRRVHPALAAEMPLDTLFRCYEAFPRAYEGYITPDFNPQEGKEPPRGVHPLFGNSQFSIRRDALGDCRFDERYVGHGFEDLDMIHQLWRLHGDDYRGELADGAAALLHVEHPDRTDDTWNDPSLRQANLRLYKAKWQGGQPNA